MKVCSTCKELKPLGSFYKTNRYKDGYKDDYKYQCKSCETEQGKKRYERLKALGFQYIKNKKEQTRKNSLKKNFGITVEQYDKFLKDQNYECAICGLHEDEHDRKLAVDHNHDTGEIRGLLCDKCNRILISNHNHPEIFIKAAEYVSKGTGLFVPKKENN